MNAARGCIAAALHVLLLLLLRLSLLLHALCKHQFCKAQAGNCQEVAAGMQAFE
jgi:hypothetical protein